MKNGIFQNLFFEEIVENNPQLCGRKSTNLNKQGDFPTEESNKLKNI